MLLYLTVNDIFIFIYSISNFEYCKSFAVVKRCLSNYYLLKNIHSCLEKRTHQIFLHFWYLQNGMENSALGVKDIMTYAFLERNSNFHLDKDL